jgi:hypothetical protein
MAKKDLSEFISQVKVRNLAKSNHFRIDLDIPLGMFEQNSLLAKSGLLEKIGFFSNQYNYDVHEKESFVDTVKTISLFCYFAQFPPTNVQVNDIYTYGTPFWQPTIKLVDRLYFGVYLDQDFKVKQFFDSWVDSIFDKNTSHLNFRSSYSTTMRLFQLDAAMEPIYGVEFYDMFPTYIEPISVHYADKNKISTLTTQFAYRTWKPINVDIHREPSMDFGILNQLPDVVREGYNLYQIYKAL